MSELVSAEKRSTEDLIASVAGSISLVHPVACLKCEWAGYVGKKEPAGPCRTCKRCPECGGKTEARLGSGKQTGGALGGPISVGTREAMTVGKLPPGDHRRYTPGTPGGGSIRISDEAAARRARLMPMLAEGGVLVHSETCPTDCDVCWLADGLEGKHAD